jgi:hypothetical protein
MISSAVLDLYLGVQHPNFLAQTDVPLFVSRRRLEARRTFHAARAPWALDSGAFKELELHGEWTITPERYVQLVRRWARVIGKLKWASVMDWSCEPWVLNRVAGHTLFEREAMTQVREHQRRTTENYCALVKLAPEIVWVPVLHGGTPQQYREHLGMYEWVNVNLSKLPLVGVRRHEIDDAFVGFLPELARLKLHAFGLRLDSLRRVAASFVSADSMAWSYAAQSDAPLPGCEHPRCTSCLKYALRWRERVLAELHEEPSYDPAAEF